MSRLIVIPGLAMHAKEVPPADDVVVLQNPEVGDAVVMGVKYTLEDVAQIHLQQIRGLAEQASGPLCIAGLGMGGMVLSILASEYRRQLPRDCTFRFIATSANTAEAQALPSNYLETWASFSPQTPDDYRHMLKLLFSKAFLSRCPKIADAYFAYRAAGGNRQKPSAFARQVEAIQAFQGSAYFERVDPAEAFFLSGRADRFFGPAHAAALKTLLPTAQHADHDNVGHMMHLEMPACVDVANPAHPSQRHPARAYA